MPNSGHTPQQYDIYLARVKWGYSEDIRRVVITEPPTTHGTVSIALISAALHLYKGRPKHFLIEKNERDPDWRAAGLTREAYVASDQVYENFDVAKLEKYKGHLQGKILKDYLDWY